MAMTQAKKKSVNQAFAAMALGAAGVGVMEIADRAGLGSGMLAPVSVTLAMTTSLFHLARSQDPIDEKFKTDHKQFCKNIAVGAVAFAVFALGTGATDENELKAEKQTIVPDAVFVKPPENN